ncbi:hypothetical protein HQ45_00115 [Porphyromonas crevioricanis]|uniref:Thioesterase domain-containing protein n=2 Tax=Porphyromonas crevioricanis TaxID=393921 RepID=A0A0A2FXW2_9PORP|nr:hotdog domain-containing protein [Porphyromonas crevioricanis]KGN91229.1 hypothetical protein HQ45_00115 [Porphyromonas crevioricanis]KGN93069.1 hypothetical protein HQ38_09925 [Porphyromonas crevioricanis]SJZ84208.1 hypothetical protein SAMN02745203_01030 [Porphyromonas crevioricanis]SQH73073.1 Uncharacterised protein [Porphyromonas crevioricanis]GAD05123.1 thioesterase family protein [Porphyromonas crevioricanis JCM 15906]
MQKTYIQQYYDEDYQHCFGCGPKNPDGLHIKSYPSEDLQTTYCHYTPAPAYSGGHPSKVYGGMIAMLFDCHGTASAAYFFMVNNGGKYGEEQMRRFVTAHLSINYRKPTPQSEELKLVAVAEEIGERKVRLKMLLYASGNLCADAEMVAVGL